MLLFNAEVINYRLNKLSDYIKRRQLAAKYYDEQLAEYVTIQNNPDNLNHNYHKYVVRFQNKEARDRVKVKIGQIHYPKPISENVMYNDIRHRKDDYIVSKIVSDTILFLLISPYITEKNKIELLIQSYY